jgi:LuxR family maltose regulon positive regulatory protein
LIEQLNRGLDNRLIVVSAPAGYGKTTLISNWLTQCPYPAAWLTLDAGEEDLARLLTYLVPALRQIHPKAGEDLLANLHTRRPSSSNKLATLLINDLAELPDRFILVLDDYHTIKSQPVHDFLAFLIDHQPPNMCLVILTRADPPLPLVRLRARGQLVEVRQGDLSFSLSETSEFISQTMSLELNLSNWLSWITVPRAGCRYTACGALDAQRPGYLVLHRSPFGRARTHCRLLDRGGVGPTATTHRILPVADIDPG